MYSCDIIFICLVLLGILFLAFVVNYHPYFDDDDDDDDDEEPIEKFNKSKPYVNPLKK